MAENSIPPGSDHSVPGPSSDHSVSEPSSDYSVSEQSSDHSVSEPSSDHSVPGPSSDHSVPEPSSDHSGSTLTTPEQYPSTTGQSTWRNEDSKYVQITPIDYDTAWAIANLYQQVHLISSTGESLLEIHTDVDIHSLGVHPTTGQLYAGCGDDETIRSIDTETGITTVIAQCDIIPLCIRVTKDNDVLVTSWGGEYPVYRYRLTGELVHTSPEKYYNVRDINQMNRTKRVVLSRDEGGAMVLNHDLTKPGLYWTHPTEKSDN